MKRESNKYLYDISRAASLLRDFISGKTLSEYEDNAMLRAAVERQCEIIGEALAQLARVDEATASRISDYQRIIAFRNVLIHEYMSIDNRLVWDIVDKIFQHSSRKSMYCSNRHNIRPGGRPRLVVCP